MEIGMPDRDALREKVIDALRTVFDPEIPVNIYELGLVYDVRIDRERDVFVRMTLTSPHCPEAEALPGHVRRAVEMIPEVGSAEVEIVWDPPWTPDRMSEAAKLELGFL
ncbi:MAG: SUF system Fe-S cluster assembly protein [Candidatus Eisenbacteria bacterium]